MGVRRKSTVVVMLAAVTGGAWLFVLERFSIFYQLAGRAGMTNFVTLPTGNAGIDCCAADYREIQKSRRAGGPKQNDAI